MGTKEIDDMIKELESSEFSLSNARNLAALYTVRDKQGEDEVTQELNDILPSYRKYVDVKRDYQLKKVSKDIVLDKMKDACREIREFLHILYSGTDMEEEREIFKQMVKEIL